MPRRSRSAPCDPPRGTAPRSRRGRRDGRSRGTPRPAPTQVRRTRAGSCAGGPRCRGARWTARAGRSRVLQGSAPGPRRSAPLGTGRRTPAPGRSAAGRTGAGRRSLLRPARGCEARRTAGTAPRCRPGNRTSALPARPGRSASAPCTSRDSSASPAPSPARERARGSGGAAGSARARARPAARARSPRAARHRARWPGPPRSAGMEGARPRPRSRAPPRARREPSPPPWSGCRAARRRRARAGTAPGGPGPRAPPRQGAPAARRPPARPNSPAWRS